jgi:hypothetical protein
MLTNWLLSITSSSNFVKHPMRIITPSEVVVKIPSRVRRLIVGVSTVSRPPTTSVTLKPSRSILAGCKSSNSYRVSVTAYVLGRLNIGAVTD